MQRSNIPTKIPIVFARDADAGHKRAVPASTPFASGGATFQYGWQDINFLPTASGGIPPNGQEFNGLFEQLTGWHRWEQAAAPIVYDGTFSAAIGGYPLGSRVESAVTSGLFWVSTGENNTTNPDAGGANWSVPFFPDPATSALIVRSTTSNGANIKFEGNAAPSPNKYIRVQGGRLEIINSAYTGAVVSVTDAGDITAARNVTAAGVVSGSSVAATAGNVTATGGSLVATFDASIGRNLGVAGQSQVNGISYFGTSGQFYANPASGSNRAISFAAGEFLQFIPGTGFQLATAAGSISLTAPASVVVSHSLTTGLDITVGRNLGASAGFIAGVTVFSTAGNVTANGGRLRAALGARNSGDNNAGALLLDFPWSNSDPGWAILPNGVIMQWHSLFFIGATGSTWVFPVAFPNHVASIQATVRGIPATTDAIRIASLGLSSVDLDFQSTETAFAMIFALGW